MRRLGASLFIALVGVLVLHASVGAQSFNSGSTGADGAFAPSTSPTVTLPPSGVFNFTTITIPAGVTVRFTRNAANTPVTLLASGDVVIAGTIEISGGAGGAGAANTTSLGNNGGLGGPGGFNGGAGANGIDSTTGGSGLGPGGGGGGSLFGAGVGEGGGGGGFVAAGTNGGGFQGATPGVGGGAYGTSALLPLIGGSGGGGGGVPFGHTASGGGGGGGALVIASSGTISFTGTILARGGNGGSVPNTAGPGTGGGGSGGAVRLIATTVTGSGGTINVAGGTGAVTNFSGGGNGAFGRVRVEGFSNTASINFAAAPPATVSSTSPTSVTLANAPTLRITSVGGVAAPATPGGSLSVPDIILPATTTSPVNVGIAASNVPTGTAVTLTVSGQVGGSSSASGTLTGSLASSTATVNVVIPTTEPGVMTATATFTLASLGAGPLYAEGEEVERVRLSAGLGGVSRVAYITKSGREIVPEQ